jgi:hypothetical protein
MVNIINEDFSLYDIKKKCFVMVYFESEYAAELVKSLKEERYYCIYVGLKVILKIKLNFKLFILLVLN